jgi:hypothetical protein
MDCASVIFVCELFIEQYVVTFDRRHVVALVSPRSGGMVLLPWHVMNTVT